MGRKQRGASGGGGGGGSGRPPPTVSKDLKHLDAYLQKHELERKPIAKDGSCLFRAVAEQVFLTQVYHQEVRMQCMRYIKAHQEEFQNFVTMPFEEYLRQLTRELWGGELELVVLSKLYTRTIIVYMYNEQLDRVDQKAIPESSEASDPIRLAYSDGNHYDIVCSSRYMEHMAMCQGILYTMLFKNVLKNAIPPSCVKRLDTVTEQDLLSRQDPQVDKAMHNLLNHYSTDSVKAMGTTMYHNAALQVHHNERASIEQIDRAVATSIQFQVGDKCRFQLPGSKVQEGEITALNSSENCHTVFIFEINEEWEIPYRDISLKHPYHGRRNPQNQQNRSKNRHGSTRSDDTYNRHDPPPNPPPPASNSEVWPTPAPSSRTQPNKPVPLEPKTGPGTTKPAVTNKAQSRPTTDKKPAGQEEGKQWAQKGSNPPPSSTPASRPKQGTSTATKVSPAQNTAPVNPRVPENTSSAPSGGKAQPQSSLRKPPGLSTPANQQENTRPVKVNGGPGGSLTSEDSNYSGNSSSDESTGRAEQTKPQVFPSHSPQAQLHSTRPSGGQSDVPTHQDKTGWQGGPAYVAGNPTDKEGMIRHVVQAQSLPPSAQANPNVRNGFPEELRGRESPYLVPQIPRDPSSQPEDDWPGFESQKDEPNLASSNLLAAMGSPHLHPVPTAFNVPGEQKFVAVTSAHFKQIPIPRPQIPVQHAQIAIPPCGLPFNPYSRFPIIPIPNAPGEAKPGITVAQNSTSAPANLTFPKANPSTVNSGLQEPRSPINAPGNPTSFVVQRTPSGTAMSLNRAQHQPHTELQPAVSSPIIRSSPHQAFTVPAELHNAKMAREYSPDPLMQVQVHMQPRMVATLAPVISKPPMVNNDTQTPLPPEKTDCSTQIESLAMTTYTQTPVKNFVDKGVGSKPVYTRTASIQASQSVKSTRSQTSGTFAPVSEFEPPDLEDEATPVDMIKFAIQYAIQCLETYAESYEPESDRADKIAGDLIEFEEKGLDKFLEHLHPALVPLDPSQQDFLQSFGGEYYASQLQQFSQQSPIMEKGFFNRQTGEDNKPGFDQREMMQNFMQQQEMLRRQGRPSEKPAVDQASNAVSSDSSTKSLQGKESDKPDIEAPAPVPQGFPQPPFPMAHYPQLMMQRPMMMIPSFFPFGGFPMPQMPPYPMMPPQMMHPGMIDPQSPHSLPGTPHPPLNEEGSEDQEKASSSESEPKQQDNEVPSHQESRTNESSSVPRLVAPSAFTVPSSAYQQSSAVVSSEVKVQVKDTKKGQQSPTLLVPPPSLLAPSTRSQIPLLPTPFETKNPYDSVPTVSNGTSMPDSKSESKASKNSESESSGVVDESQNLPNRGGKQNQKPQQQQKVQSRTGSRGNRSRHSQRSGSAQSSTGRPSSQESPRGSSTSRSGKAEEKPRKEASAKDPSSTKEPDNSESAESTSRNRGNRGHHSYQKNKGTGGGSKGGGGPSQGRQPRQQSGQASGSGGASGTSGRSGNRGGKRQETSTQVSNSGRGAQDPSRSTFIFDYSEKPNLGVPYTAYQPRAFHGGFPSPNHPSSNLYDQEETYVSPLPAVNQPTKRWKFTDTSNRESKKPPFALPQDLLDWGEDPWPQFGTEPTAYSETVEDPFANYPASQNQWDSDIGDMNISLTVDPLTEGGYPPCGVASNTAMYCNTTAKCVSESVTGKVSSKVDSECVVETVKLPK